MAKVRLCSGLTRRSIGLRHRSPEETIMSQKTPRNFFKPLAIGAPAPMRDLPVKIERMIHFVPPHLDKVRAKVPDMAPKVDVILANLEDAIPADAKDAARTGAIEMANMYDWQGKGTGFWSRVNPLNSPWFQDDVSELVLKAGHQLDVIMLPKVEGPWDIHFADQYVAQLEAKAGLTRPILFHAILETAQGMSLVEEIALASPRMQGISLGPADLAADRKMKTTRVGGGHPFYRVLEDPHADGSERASVQQDLWHYTIARMVDACRMAGINAFYGPFGDISDLDACEQQFRNAFLLGCAGAWSLHPNQIDIAKRVFSPDPDEVKFARRILEAMPDGTGVAMLDGKMQDDATWKQAKVIADLADLVAAKDSDLAAAYNN
jgi:malyl-CoA/(S)-citramalyl-CoA lyase